MYERRYMTISGETLKDPVAIVGLPGIANVGRIAADALVETLDAVLAKEFFSDDFAPRVMVRNGLTYFPRSSIHVYRSPPEEAHDILILTADFQPSSPQGVYSYCDYVVREFTSLRVKTVIALAAYEQEHASFFEKTNGGPRVYISASSEKLLRDLSSINNTVVTSEGVISGANGFIPAWAATMYDMEGACLMGETVSMIKMDYRAARAVLQVATQLLEISADLSILDEPASKVDELIEWARSEIEQSRQNEDKDDSWSDHYIG